ncbi:hypothetical protein JW899_00800 [Candidatus Uhrbacteria bacterium]|nr:hypothetical protein [Candidatus Uhrbacteria bacterium]
MLTGRTLATAALLATIGCYVAGPALAEEAFICEGTDDNPYPTAEACDMNCLGECTTVNLTPEGSVDTTVSGGAKPTEATPAFQTRILENPLGKEDMDIPMVIARVIEVFTGIVGSLALLVFIYGSFLLMTSAGESKRVESGKQAMFWAVGGLVVMFASYAFLKVLLRGLGT